MSSTTGANRLKNDAYHTPDELARVLVGQLPIVSGQTVLEPHAGGGAFMRALYDHGEIHVRGLDLDPTVPAMEYETIAHDFLGPWPDDWACPDWVVGNPPFRGAERHVLKALSVSNNVAFLLRLAFLETGGRIPFWRKWPARKVWVLSQRPSFTGGGTDSCAYGFFWWDKLYEGPTTLEVLDWRAPR